MTNTMNKIVNGKLIELTPEEIAEYEARQPTDADVLQEAKDSKIAELKTNKLGS